MLKISFILSFPVLHSPSVGESLYGICSFLHCLVPISGGKTNMLSITIKLKNRCKVVFNLAVYQNLVILKLNWQVLKPFVSLVLFLAQMKIYVVLIYLIIFHSVLFCKCIHAVEFGNKEISLDLFIKYCYSKGCRYCRKRE